jgi:hypothetical protein
LQVPLSSFSHIPNCVAFSPSHPLKILKPGLLLCKSQGFVPDKNIVLVFNPQPATYNLQPADRIFCRQQKILPFAASGCRFWLPLLVAASGCRLADLNPRVVKYRPIKALKFTGQ